MNARLPQIRAVVANSIAAQTGNIVGRRTVLRGSYPWPLVQWVGENPNDQPDVDTPLPSRILDPGPCGYFIPQAEYTMARGTFGSVETRLADHGIKAEPQVGGVLVPLKQPYGGLVAPILDSEAVLPMIETAQRRYSCPKVDLPVGGTVPATLSLTLGAPASFGAFTPGVAKDYTASTTANVISTAGDATLTVGDPTPAGCLVNGTFALPSAARGARSAKSTWTRARSPTTR